MSPHNITPDDANYVIGLLDYVANSVEGSDRGVLKRVKEYLTQCPAFYDDTGLGHLGGAAFPQPDREEAASPPDPGMSLRDYFIAHAPAEVPEWFLATMTWECPMVPSWHALTSDQKRAVEQLELWPDGEDFPGRAEAVEWVRKREEAIMGQEAWQAEFRRECVLQWPIYWATEMVKRRAI